MKTYKDIFVLFLLFGLTSCDPGLKGDLKVFNETNQVLTVKYKNDYVENTDTISLDIQPNSDGVLKVLSGLGNKKTFDCCPCVTNIFYIKSALGHIKKNPTVSDNWTIPNKNKLKKYGKEPVKCEFHVTQADL